VEGGTILTKFMTKFFIAVALMPVGDMLGIMLAAMLMFDGELPSTWPTALWRQIAHASVASSV
jgi:hypothetical protein